MPKYNSGGIPVRINARYGLDPDGFIVDLQRPVLNNPDGSQATEESMTVGDRNDFFNIPTIVNGERVGQDQAMLDARLDMMMGNSPNYRTLAEALMSAPDRSSSIGNLRGMDNHPSSRSAKLSTIFRGLF